MKNTKNLSLLGLLTLVFSGQIAISQTRYSNVYKNKLILGINIIDDSFTTHSNPFNIKEEWNTALYPSYFGYNTAVFNNVSLDFSATINKLKNNKLVNGAILQDDQKYYALDLNAKYNLSGLIYKIDKLSNLEPFLAAGGGITSINGAKRLTFNYGLGTYIWFNKYENKCCSESIWNNLGIVFQTMGKSSLKNKTYGNQIQHTFGIVYRY